MVTSHTSNEPLGALFKKPAGILGRIAGWIMEWQNAELNRFTIHCLNVNSEDTVLEIGFGTGAALEQLAQNTQAKRIYGIEFSREMVEEAAVRNRAFVTAGRVQLCRGSVLQLPFGSNLFSRVFAVSTFHDWEDRAAGLQEIRRVLRAHGRLVLCLRSTARTRLPWSSPGVTQHESREDQRLIARCGFHRVQICQVPRHRICCLVAEACSEK